MKSRNPLCSSGITDDPATDGTTQITSVSSLSPICSLLPDGLTSPFLLNPESSDKLSPRTRLEDPPLASCQSSWWSADWREGRGLLDSLQTCVKYAESESLPCQRSLKGVPIARKHKAQLRGITV